MNLLFFTAMSTDCKTETLRSVLPWPLAVPGGGCTGGVGAPVTVLCGFGPQGARNQWCQLCLQMCQPSPLPIGSRGFAKSDERLRELVRAKARIISLILWMTSGLAASHK